MYKRQALQWAVDNGYLASVPKIPKVQRAKKAKVQPMKGRPLLLEEFEKLILAVPKIILTPNPGRAKDKEREPDQYRIPSWEFLIRGLWLSGLRLGEAMDLHWTDQERFRIDLETNRYPMFRINAENEKGATDRWLPMTPDAAQFFQSVPKSERNGFVFNPLPQNEGKQRLSQQTVGRTIGDIGEAAGVILDKKAGKAQYPSAHDLRRSFGDRWAARLMPARLQELMRHESIDTTLRFYVAQNADRTAQDLWERFGDNASVGSVLGATTESSKSEVQQTP